MRNMNLRLPLFTIFILFSIFACTSSKKSRFNYPDCSSLDIEKSDTCLLGLTISQAIDKLKLDSSQVYAIQEPIAVVRGITYMPDSNTRVELFVERSPIKAKLDSIARTNGMKINVKYLYQFVMHKEIVAVRWEKEMGARSKIVIKK
jgi:hypothetical protein